MILADTSGFFAVLDRTEPAHERAGSAWVELVARETVITHSYVLGETASLLQSRVGMPALERFRVLIEPVLDVVWIDKDLHDLAINATLAAARRKVSIVDHASFVVMRRLGVTRAFALDAHFAEQGFELVPAAA